MSDYVYSDVDVPTCATCKHSVDVSYDTQRRWECHAVSKLEVVGGGRIYPSCASMRNGKCGISGSMHDPGEHRIMKERRELRIKTDRVYAHEKAAYEVRVAKLTKYEDIVAVPRPKYLEWWQTEEIDRRAKQYGVWS